MTPTRRLARLQRQTKGRLGKLRREAWVATASTDYLIRDRASEHLALTLLNTWANFNRAYYQSCFMLPTRATGGRIRVDGRCSGWTMRDALDNSIIAVRGWTPKPGSAWSRRDEAAWHVVDNLIKACANVACSNQADIEAAFGAGQKVFLDLPVFRNYFGHRNRDTKQSALRRVSAYGIPAATPGEALLARPLRRPQALILEWIDEVEVTVEFLCA